MMHPLSIIQCTLLGDLPHIFSKQVELKNVSEVVGITTKGIHSNTYNSYVISYEVLYSLDGQGFVAITPNGSSTNVSVLR